MRRLPVHAAGLAVVLLLGLVFVGTEGVVSADEGAMLAELDLLDRTGDWTLPNPEPEVDPDRRHLPLELSERAEDGAWAPFAKHPVHVLLLRPAWAVGGTGGVLVLSVASVVVAAVAAAALAERLRAGAGVPALWLTGVGSPLLFDGYQVVGHAMGAAAFGVAAVGATAAATSSRPAARWVGVAVAVGGCALAGLVRSEGVLAGLALAAAFGVGGVLRRDVPVVATAVGCGIAAAAVRLGEPALLDGVLGSPSVSAVALGTSGVDEGGLAGRWEGFRTTVLEAGYGVDAGEPLLLVALVLLVAAAAVWRRSGDERLVRLLVVGAAVAAVGRAVTADFLVPGLLPATPLLAVAAVLLRRRHLEPRPAAELLGAVALFAAAVAATQYATGGGGEWGGRYFAVGLPLAVALVAVVLADVAAALPTSMRRAVGAATLLVLVSIAAGALRATERARDASSRSATSVVAGVDRLEADATVAARGAISRFAWEDVLDGRRWLTSEPGEVAALVERLATDGVDRVALLHAPGDDAAELAPPGWAVAASEAIGSTRISLLAPSA